MSDDRDEEPLPSYEEARGGVVTPPTAEGESSRPVVSNEKENTTNESNANNGDTGEANANEIDANANEETRGSTNDRRSTRMTKEQEVAAERRRPPRIVSADSYYGRSADTVTDADNHDASSEEDPDAPPAYSDTYGRISEENGDVRTNARVGDDGRVNIRINQHGNRLTKILVPALRVQLEKEQVQLPAPPPYIPPSLGGEPGQMPPPPMNVVIHVVGSRGDVQPFVALGKVLKETYNHRVRLATHPTFKKFVEENDLEFFSIGGDPAELMAFMVKNPGLMPGFDSLRSGDVGKRRKQIGEMIQGAWRSCYEAGDGQMREFKDSDQPIENWIDSTQGEGPDLGRPFVADAIIANPPSFAHIHCAERLGIPLHMMFTMPWSPTQLFPHPLANIQSSNADTTMTNYMSYALVDMLTWQGLGDVINRFRQRSLGLEPLSVMWAPGTLSRMRIPYTYCWSPALIPKPGDWGQHISISGFYFLNLASNYTPDPELDAYLKAGTPPVYIGFGSIVVDDPNAMTKLIFDAVKITGQRALVSKGWGGLGADEMGVPDGVYMLGNCPHDWLFQHVSCVVHHGGAGTTAAGIKAGRPTVVVPFFGDQPFWGAMVAKAGAGPMPVPHKQLTAEKLAAAITEALKPTSLERAKELASKISEEKGTDVGAQSFHQTMEVDKLRCSLLPERTAVWRVKRTKIRLSALAAYTLAEKDIVSFTDLKPYRPKEYEMDDGPWDPITGGGGAIMSTMGSMLLGVADFPIETLKALRIHPEAVKAAIKDKKSQHSSSQGSGSKRITMSDNLSKTSVVTSVSESSQESKVTSGSSIRRKPLVSTPPTASDRLQPTASEDSPNDIQLVQSPISTVDDPTLLTPPAQHTRSTSSAMSEALRNLPENSRPRSPSRHSHTCHTFHGSHSPGHESPRSTSPTGTPSAKTIADHMETAMGTAKGVRRIVGAGLKSPMDFSLALSKGFHNVPKLYGEEVRQVDRVTGIKSGLTTAGKEFGYGLYDGVTGLFTQPYLGAKKEGAAGFVKGIGKGIVGIQVKPAAGALGIAGYAMQGLYREWTKKFGESTEAYITAARTAQGFEEWRGTTREFRLDVVHSYLVVLRDTKRKRGVPGEEGMDAVAGGVEAVEKFIEKRKEARRRNLAKLAGMTRLGTKGKRREFSQGSAIAAPTDAIGAPPLVHTDTVSSDGTSELLRGSISRSSAGSAATAVPAAAPLPPASLQAARQVAQQAQQASPAAGISVEPLHHYTDDDDDELYADPQAERPAAAAPTAATAPAPPADEADDDDDEDAADAASLAEAMRQSLTPSSQSSTADDRQIERAIRASLAELQRTRAIDVEEEEAEDDDLRRVLTESARLHHGAGGANRAADAGDDADDALPGYDDLRWRDPDDEQESGVLAAAEPPRGRDRHVRREVPAAAELAALAPEAEEADAIDDEEEEQIRRALEESLRQERSGAGVGAQGDDGEEELRRAMEESLKHDGKAENGEEELRKAMEESLKMDQERERQRHEEEIILEYVKKASLAEEEFKRRMTDRAEAVGSYGANGAEAETVSGLENGTTKENGTAEDNVAEKS